MTDWHLQPPDVTGHIFIHFQGENGAFQQFNLGPRDEVLQTFADYFGDDGVGLPAGEFHVPESGGTAG